MNGRPFRRGSVFKVLRLTNTGRRCVEFYLPRLLRHAWRKGLALRSRLRRR